MFVIMSSLCVSQESDLGEESSSKGKLEERKFAFKKDNVCCCIDFVLVLVQDSA